MADHSQAPDRGHDRAAGRARRARRARTARAPRRSALARSRGSPSARRSARRWSMRCTSPSATRCAPPSSRARSRSRGVDLVMWLERDAHDAPREGGHREPAARRAALRARRRAARRARRAPGASRATLAVLDGERSRTAACSARTTPTRSRACGRRSLCPTSGEVLLSAAPGYEFIDWGRQAHVGGGSHGSLHACDSLGALILTGVALPIREPAQWTIRDVAPLVLEHFRRSGPREAVPSARCAHSPPLPSQRCALLACSRTPARRQRPRRAG